MTNPEPRPAPSRRWSTTEWLTVIGGVIAVLGFLGYSNFKSILPVGSLDSAIVGEWQATDIPWHLRFGADGSCAMSTIGPPKSCRYRLDGSMLFVDTTDGRHLKTTAKLSSRDRLELIDANGSATRFQRAD